MAELKHRIDDLIDNRYQVRKIMGSGAFGTVYGCRDTELDVPVAVKELHVLDEAERAVALAQFRAEAQHLSRLRHPNIVSGHYEPVSGDWHVCPICGLDWPQKSARDNNPSSAIRNPQSETCPDHGAQLIEIKSRYYLVMEYIAGPDLLQLAERRGGKLDEAEALLYGQQIASALAHIHARDLVHRDIKPENIRLRPNADKTAEAVLLDFGIATQGQGRVAGDAYGTRAQRHTQGGGTVGYAPDSPTERRNPDARSDIHAWGMTWYHLLSGLDPTEPDELRRMRVHRLSGFAPELGEDWDELIGDCIDPEPIQRPQNGAQLLERLDEIGAEETPATAPVAASNTAVTVQKQPQFQAPIAPPMVFKSGHAASTVGELVWLLDAYAREGIGRLFSGDIERFLVALGETELAVKSAQIRQRFGARQEQGLEAFIAATGLLARPQLQVHPARLDFGTIKADGKKTIQLELANIGRGHLSGLVRASLGAVATPGGWDGNRARLPVSFDGMRLNPGHYEGEIELDGSAGQTRIPFSAKVAGPSLWPPFLTVVWCGAAGATSGALSRTVPWMYDSAVPGWLSSVDQVKLWPIAPIFGATLWACAAVWTLVESTRKKSCGMVLGLGTFGTILAILAAIGGQSLIVEWDTILKPILKPHVGNYAVGGWMAAGAAIGAGWGAIRRVGDWFSPRLFGVVAGLGAVGAMVWLALQSASGK